MSDPLTAAKSAITDAHRTGANLCDPFLSLVPASGAAVSVLAGLKGQATVCASSPTAARLDELQFDLGEGPCWVAMNTRMPVLDPHVNDGDRSRWPMFSDAMKEDELVSRVSSMFAFPLAVGPLDIGAVDLYSLDHRDLDATQVADLSELARVTAFQVLRRILTDDGDDEPVMAPGSRREVHQATGMVLAQLDIDAEDAALLIRAHAFSTGRSVREVASDVVARRLDFSSDEHRDRDGR